MPSYYMEILYVLQLGPIGEYRFHRELTQLVSYELYNVRLLSDLSGLNLIIMDLGV